MLKKIALIGAGIRRRARAGAVPAQARRTVALVDVRRRQATGKCLEIAEGTPIIGSDVRRGGQGVHIIKDADLVVNDRRRAASVRPDGTFPSREELLATNAEITDTVAATITQYLPDATIISIADPLDAIVLPPLREAEPAQAQADGHGGRPRLGRLSLLRGPGGRRVGGKRRGLVLGGHGDDMVPICSCCRIAGMPVEKFVDEKTLAGIEARTRKAGGEIVGLIGVSAFWSRRSPPSRWSRQSCTTRRSIIPSCVLLEGEYGVKGLCVGVPVVLGKGGVERIIELDLNEIEKAAFAKSIEAVKKTTDEVIATK